AEFCHHVIETWRVYPNRKNRWGLDPFHTNGTSGGKFDFLLIRRGYEDSVFKDSLARMPISFPTCIGVEAKDGDHMENIVEGIDQMERYYRDLVSGQTFYYLDDGRVVKHVDCILLTKQYSPGGFLYKHEAQELPMTFDFWSQSHKLREYLASKFIASSIYKAKARALDRARVLAAQNGFALSAVPEMGVLKRGILLDGRLTPGLMAFLPCDVVPITNRVSGDAA
ncbi:MAG: hypothetical protein Q6353_020920, partial [Candidatus Sigynarchaeum springense]